MTKAPLRVPAVREVAVVGDTAIVRGYSAWFLHRVLRGYPGGLEALLSRSGVPEEKRRDILLAQAALGQAGAMWRLAAASTSGSAEGDGGSTALPSGVPVIRSFPLGMPLGSSGSPTVRFARSLGPLISAGAATLAVAGGSLQPTSTPNVSGGKD